MTTAEVVSDAVLSTWRTSDRVTAFLFQRLPDEVLDMKVPKAPKPWAPDTASPHRRASIGIG